MVIEYLRVLFNPWVAAGVGLLIVWLLSRMALLSLADLSFVLPVTSIGYVLTAVVGWAVLGEHISAGRWAGTLLIMGGTALVGSTEARTTKPETVRRAGTGRGTGVRRRIAMNWALVGIIVAATVLGDVLQTLGMRHHGEIHDFRPGALGRVAAALASNWYVIVAVGMMAVSFFTFLKLLSVADLSFAVPATAASFVIETVIAKYFLKERVNWKRWTGAALVAGGVALLAL